MLCKKTYKNQITLPKKIMEPFAGIEYFDITATDEEIVLKPAKITPVVSTSLAGIRKKISSLGLTEKDIDKAIEWARKK